MKRYFGQFLIWLGIFCAVLLIPLFWLASWMDVQFQQFVGSFSEMTRLLIQNLLKGFAPHIGQSIAQLFDGVLMGVAFLILPWAIIVAYLIYRLVARLW